jgi:hypothetical protein
MLYNTMYRSRRIKRASEQDLYKVCVEGRDCATDIKNKYEGTTLADILLKAFGSILYFGNVGIGTGRGSGGNLGYGRLGGGGSNRIPTGTIPTRPTIPLDTFTTDILPIDPNASVIVPLSEGLPDTAGIDVAGAGPGLGAESIDVTTVIDPLSEVTGLGEHPSVTISSDNVAQIDVQVHPPPPKRVLLDSSIRNTTEDVVTHVSHVDPDINIFVDARIAGEHVGTREMLELQEINLRDTFEIEEGPRESTPLTSRVFKRARDLYNRYTQQVRTDYFVGQLPPTTTFEFENPAFSDDVIEQFSQEVQRVADSAQSRSSVTTVSELVQLSDIRFGESPGGTIRVSRLGQKAGMTTRSGLQVGPRVHFYYDLTPIPKESIELNTYGEYSHESTIVDELTQSSFINPFEQPIFGTSEFPDSSLLDTLTEDFSNAHIIISNTDSDGEAFQVPIIPPTINIQTTTNNTHRDLFVNHNPTISPNIVVPFSPNIPLFPAYSVAVESFDYDLHPSYLKRKRKLPFI